SARVLGTHEFLLRLCLGRLELETLAEVVAYHRSGGSRERNAFLHFRSLFGQLRNACSADLSRIIAVVGGPTSWHVLAWETPCARERSYRFNSTCASCRPIAEWVRMLGDRRAKSVLLSANRSSSRSRIDRRTNASAIKATSSRSTTGARRVTFLARATSARTFSTSRRGPVSPTPSFQYL